MNNVDSKHDLRKRLDTSEQITDDLLRAFIRIFPELTPETKKKVILAFPPRRDEQ